MPDPLTTPDPYPAVPALTAQELEEWRWYISPSVQTAEDRSRAECDRQPNIVACLRDHRGCRRARPEVVLVEGRAQNDYDHLFDARVYSPNNRMRGTWDFDAEEIARENAFPVEEDIQPPPGQRPGVDFIPPRTPTPPPEEDSLEAMMYSSIASPRPDSRNVLIFMNNAIRNNIGIRRHEIRDFAFRFRRLPAELRPLVIIERQRDDIFWMDALERVEDQVWWYNLTPTQRKVFTKVKRVFHFANDHIESLGREGIHLVAAFRYLVIEHWMEIDAKDEAYSFETFMTTGSEQIVARGGGSVIRGEGFWMCALAVIEMSDLPLQLRRIAILRVLNLQRFRDFQRVAVLLLQWIHDVGNRAREMEGVYVRGDFWKLADKWEADLEFLEDRAEPGILEVDEMTRDELARRVYGWAPQARDALQENESEVEEDMGNGGEVSE